MSDLQRALERLPVAEPTWFFHGRHLPQAPLDEAAILLSGLPDEDLAIFVLAYGLGMRLGDISTALHVEPALVVWHVRRSLEGHANERDLDPALLERAVVDLLRGADPGPHSLPPTRAARSWETRDLLAALDESVLERLSARLVADPTDQPSRAGVGIGTLGAILVVVLGFLVFGVIRDVNPLWRGRALVQRGEYERAMAALTEALERKIGDAVEVREQMVLCLLAQGHFELAYAELAVPGVLDRFGAFGPWDEPLETAEADSSSLAWLPRGHTLNRTPDFVHGPGPAGVLTLTVNWRDQTRTMSVPLPDSTSLEQVRVEWPSSFRPLPPGSSVVWMLELEDAVHQATFTVADAEEHRSVGQAFARFLTRSVPGRTREFFRGHYYLNKGYLTKAAAEFAALSKRFPDRAYPVDQVQRIADALSLDPSVFLR